MAATSMSGFMTSTDQTKFTINNRYPSAIQTNGLLTGIGVPPSAIRLLHSASARQYLLNVYKAAVNKMKLSARAVANSVPIPGWNSRIQIASSHAYNGPQYPLTAVCQSWRAYAPATSRYARPSG